MATNPLPQPEPERRDYPGRTPTDRPRLGSYMPAAAPSANTSGVAQAA